MNPYEELWLMFQMYAAEVSKRGGYSYMRQHELDRLYQWELIARHLWMTQHGWRETHSCGNRLD